MNDERTPTTVQREKKITHEMCLLTHVWHRVMHTECNANETTIEWPYQPCQCLASSLVFYAKYHSKSVKKRQCRLPKGTLVHCGEIKVN